MYRRVFGLFFIFGLFSILFIFTPTSVNAGCNGSVQCYQRNTFKKCAISGNDCSTNSCPPGDPCATIFTYTPSNVEQCSGIIGAGDSLICNSTSISCTGSGGGIANVQCSWSGSSGTPAPTSSGGGGGCTSGYCQTTSICASQGGTTGSQGGCSSGTVQCCLPSQPPPPPPTQTSQGAFVYCQDGAGPVYPLSGVTIAVHDTMGSVQNWSRATDANGRTFFDQMSPDGDFTVTMSGVTFVRAGITGVWSQIQHPLSTSANYDGDTLSTGQLFTNLTPGDTHSSALQACQSGAWFNYASGPGFPHPYNNWFCAGYFTYNANPPTNGYQLASSYYFDIPTYSTGKYGIQYHFSNCSGPVSPPGCGPYGKSILGTYAATFAASSDGFKYLNNAVLTINSQQTNGDFSGIVGGYSVNGTITAPNSVIMNLVRTSDGMQFATTGTIDASGNWSGNFRKSDNAIVGTYTMTKTTCVDGPSCACTPAPPTCTISVSPSSYALTGGGTVNVSPSISQTNGTVDQVTYSSSNSSFASVVSPKSSAPFTTTVTGGGSSGTATITVNGLMGGVQKCSTTFTVTNTITPAWWQVSGGDVITNGNLQSKVPAGQVFNADGSWGYPGNNMFGGTSTLNNGNASTQGWLGDINYQGKVYDSAYFNNILPSTIAVNSLPSVAAQSDFDGGTVASDGYKWFRVNGNLTTNGNISIGGSNKIVLFVTGNLTINGNLTVANNGQGFFMTIVGGDINVAPGVTAGASTALEGIFESDGDFNLGGGTNQLHIRGSVVAYGNVVLNRNTGLVAPSEIFEYAPDLIMLFPRSLVQDTFGWEEVVP